MNPHILQKPFWLHLRAHPFSRWLYWPLWRQIRYMGKFGSPDPMGFVSLSPLGHRHTPAEPQPPPAEPVPLREEEPRRKTVVHLVDYVNFPLFLTDCRTPTKPAA